MGLAFLEAHIHVREAWIQSKTVDSVRMEEVVRSECVLGRLATVATTQAERQNK